MPVTILDSLTNTMFMCARCDHLVDRDAETISQFYPSSPSRVSGTTIIQIVCWRCGREHRASLMTPWQPPLTSDPIVTAGSEPSGAK